MGSIKELSKKDYSVDRPTLTDVQVGAFLRIADGVETIAANTAKMASNYLQMQNDLRWYRDRCDAMDKEIQQLKHSRAGYMAALTKLRNRDASLSGETYEPAADSHDIAVSGEAAKI